MNPTLFISHGAPNTILVDSKTKINFKNITKEFKKPKYIVVISAHWHTKGLKIINPLAKDQKIQKRNKKKRINQKKK